jgi:Leucine-rich repeat (LRR) protein
LPPSIGNLKKLEFLYLNDNQLLEIPNEIGNLTNLRFLVIGKNSLTELPVTLGNLTSLVELDIARSGPMLTLPESVSNCRRIEYLYIDNTTILPYSLNTANPRLRIVVK